MPHLEPCVPPLWARGGHAQTLLAHFLPSPPVGEPGERFELALDDGDKLVGTLYPGKSDWVVYAFHGLSGSILSPYMQRTARLMRARGHTVALVNHRGCGEGRGHARHPYHSGRGEDLSAALAWGRQRFPGHRHLAVGFSLGANALLLLLTGARGDVKPDAAIAVNAPIHLENASRALRVGWNFMYDSHFVQQCLRDVVHRHGKRARELGLRPRLPLMMSLRQFDQSYTAPYSGFRDRDDYYDSCSTYDKLERIDRPTVVLTAADDPFVPVADYRAARVSDRVRMHIEPCGGHVGYLSGRPTPLGTRRWLDYAIDEHARALMAGAGHG